MSVISFTLILLVGLGFPFSAWSEGPSHLPSPKMLEHMKQSNAQRARTEPLVPKQQSPVDRLPYAEYETAEYLFFSADFYFNSEHVKKTILENLPDEVTPIIYTSDSSEYEKSRIKSHFSSVISPERIKIATLDRTDRGFWARDGIPVPTISKDVAQFNPQLSLVDARYYYPFEPDQVVAQLFQAPLISHEYYFEGGNFMANRVGDCLIVNKSATQDIPDSVFEIKYGCVTLLRLPHVKGIGHADESVKFVNDTTVFTDTEEYIPLLRERGFEVVRLPRAYGNYETYVNSLIINGVVFVPIFDQSTDEEAIEIYERFGFTVIPINTETLSNNGLGSIHCISMTYPPSSYQDILRAIGAKELN